MVGLCLPGAPYPLPLICQYANDTSLIVSSVLAIQAAFDTYYLFERGSGSRLNLSKSKGPWLGSWTNRVDPLNYSPMLICLGQSFGRLYWPVRP